MIRDAANLEFLGQRAFCLTHNVGLEQSGVQMSKQVEHGALYTAQQRQDLYVADADHDLPFMGET